MRHLWQWFWGYVCIALRGRQINRFLNLCSKNGIRLWAIRYDLEHAVRVHISLRNFFELKPYLRKTKTRMRILNKRGFPFWCHRHPKLKWFLAMCVCTIVLVFYSFSFIWNIEINGNAQVSTDEIIAFLSEQKIETGMKRKDINCPDVEYRLREQFKNLGWVSVFIEHTKLCIEVKESLYDTYEFEIEDGHQYDLVAQKDAKIFSIVTRTGTAVVKAGDVVKANDILVKGQCDILDDAGIVKDTLLLKADATIWADVSYEFVANISEIEVMALKITGLYSDEMLKFIGNEKINHFLENLEENGVIILNKNVMIDKKEKNIVFVGKIQARETIGINVNTPVEEIRENEFE